MFQSIAPNIRKNSCFLSDNETFSIVQKYIFYRVAQNFMTLFRKKLGLPKPVRLNNPNIRKCYITSANVRHTRLCVLYSS